jgi:hypothetical protein
MIGNEMARQTIQPLIETFNEQSRLDFSSACATATM